MDEDFIVTAQDLCTVPNWNGEIGYCFEGARLWFARHGLDWRDFVQNGLPASFLESTDDALALRLVAHARAQRATEAAAKPQEAGDDTA